MVKSKILIIAAAIVVIVAISVYTFGSQSNAPKVGTKENPVNPIGQAGSVGVGSPVKISTFVNRENPGNFYSIQFPANAVVVHGNGSGSYLARLPQGVFNVQLVDIPDTSNVQLTLLTQIEPALKSSLNGFNRVGYNQLTIGGNRAWDLTYSGRNATIGTEMESIKTVIEGSDHAAAITFSAPRQELVAQNVNSTVIRPVVNSFHWLGQ